MAGFYDGFPDGRAQGICYKIDVVVVAHSALEWGVRSTISFLDNEHGHIIHFWKALDLRTNMAFFFFFFFFFFYFFFLDFFLDFFKKNFIIFWESKWDAIFFFFFFLVVYFFLGGGVFFLHLLLDFFGREGGIILFCHGRFFWDFLNLKIPFFI